MGRWHVETRVTLMRYYMVDAENEKDAEAASVGAEPTHEEEIGEETMIIVPCEEEAATGV